MIARLCAAFALALPLQRADGPVATEFLVRDRAAALDASRDALAADLDAEDWRTRFAVVDVLARTRGGDAEHGASLVSRALADDHPNVRARALDAAAVRRIAIPPDRLDALLDDRWPATRAALVRWIALARPPGAAAHLARLATDPDVQVGDRAFRALLALGDEGAEQAAAEWRRRDLASDAERLLAATEALANGPRADALFLALEVDAAPAVSALLAAAEARVGGPADPRALLAGWFVPYDADAAISELRRDAQLQAGAEAFGFALIPHLARDLDAVNAWLLGKPTDLERRRPDLARRLRAGEVSVLECRGEWSEAAVAAARGEGARLVELTDALGQTGFVAFAEAAYGRLESLAPPRSPSAERRRTPASRFVWTELAGEVYTRTRDDGAAQWLMRALEDEHGPCRREALYALSSVPDLRPFDRALYEAWIRLDRAEALDYLPRLSRRHALPSFRDDWLSLWTTGYREVSLLEMLAAFEGDDEVIDAFEVWLRRELRALEQAAREEETTHEPSEGVAKALLVGLIRLGAGDAIFAEALERAADTSEEVAKTAAARLGTTAAGRDELIGWLAPARPQRLRLEAALALAPVGVDAAVPVLVSGFDACDEELQVRALRALGASGSEAGWSLPARVAADRGAGAGARLVAYEVLGDGETAERAVALLAELAAEGRDLDGRRLALRALGRVADPVALASLEALAADGFLHESLRDEWLVAAARCAGEAPPAWVLDAWGLEPRGRATDALRTRFRGTRTAAVDFTYRAELEAGSALAPVASDLLAASEGWRHGDARWLFELSELWLAQGAEDAARTVAAAAEVGLAGEAPADDLGLVRARVTVRAIEAARADGRYEEAARRADELRLALLLGDLRTRDWERVFGSVDRAEGRDPRARIAALAHDSRARAALARGDLAEARAFLARARAERGDSEHAARECRRLARAIEDQDQ